MSSPFMGLKKIVNEFWKIYKLNKHMHYNK